MTDRILASFLERQLEEGMALAAESDLFELLPVEPPYPQRYVVIYRCRGLILNAAGLVAEADRFMIGIKFPDDYLLTADPFTVLTWLGPQGAWHPQIRPPFLCIGRLFPGTPLVDILYRAFEVITFNRVTMREDDALCQPACSWARRNGHRFPVDTRPLKRPGAGFDVIEATR
jgi:hypothetical protein